MADLDEPYFVLARPQPFEHTVDPVPRQPKYGVYTPIDETLDQDIADCFRHLSLPHLRCKRCLVAAGRTGS
jgi:hypothetical protein